MARPIVKYLDPVSGGYEFATVVDIGDLRNLNTTIKSDIVGAINSIISDGVHNPVNDERIENLETIIDSLKDGTFQIEDFGSIDEHLKQKFLEELDKINAQNREEMQSVLTKLDTSVDDAIRGYQEKVAAQNIILENAENTLVDARGTLEAKAAELETAKIGFSELKTEFDELDGYITTNIRTIDFDNFNAMVEDYETIVTQTSDEVGVDMSGSTLSYLTGRVTEAEANISAQADEITSKMSYDEFQYMPVPKYSYGENLLFDTFDFGDAWSGKNGAQVTPDTFLFGKVVAFNSPTGLYETRTDDLTIGESYVLSTYVNVQPSEKGPSQDKYEPISTSYDPTDFKVQIGGASFNPGVYEDLSGINGWVRINQEFVADAVNPIISITPVGVNSQSEVAYMAMPKVEKGLTVTPWQPHLEDNYATISSTQSMIKQQANSITAFVTEVSELDDSYKQATSTFKMLADGFEANTEAVKNYEDAVIRYGTEYSNINGKFEQKVWKDDFKTAIEDINIDNRNRVLNSDFIRNEISSSDRRLIVEDWSLNSDWEIKTIDNDKYLSRNRTGLTQNLITSASSDYFPVRNGERILFGFDLIHSGLDNDKVFAIELFDISDKRLLKQEFSLSSLAKVGNRYHGSFSISTPGVEKGNVVLQLPKNGSVSFTKILFQNADIGSVDWSPAPEDSWIIQSKLETYISQVEDEITIGGTGQKLDTLTGLLTEDKGTFTLNPDKIASEVLNSKTYDDMGFVNKTNFEQTADGWIQEITSEGRLAGYINASPDTYRISFDKILLEGTTWADALGSSKIMVTENFALIGKNGTPVLDVKNDGSINMNITSLKIGEYNALTTNDKSDIESEVADKVINTTKPYIHIAYADTEDGQGLSFNPSGKQYIGFAKSHLPTPSGTASNYEWSKYVGADGYEGADGVGIKSTTVRYASSTSGTSQPSTGWSSTIPTVEPGNYLWTEIVWTYTNSEKKQSYTVARIGRDGEPGEQGPRGLTGAQGPKGDQGIKGADGKDGKSSYTHIAYADTMTGTGFSHSDASKPFIGIYTDNNPTSSGVASKYTWSKWHGEDGSDGVQGPKGADGLPSYTHFAYANNATGTSGFSTTDSLNKSYLGIYTDNIKADSEDPAKYTWTLIKGATGARGPQGIQGLQGPKGDQGIKGNTGADGKSSYTHIAYATGNQGQSFSHSTFEQATHVGMYVSNNQNSSDNWRDYEWTLIRGRDGSQGVRGPQGADGKTPYFHIAYANNSTGTSGFSINDSANKLYIGTYTDFEPDDSLDPSKYNWTLVKGAKGDRGDTGKDGVAGKDGVGIKSTTITYGVSPNETTQPATYTSTVPTLVKGQYLWTKTVWVYTDSTTETGYTKTYIPKDGNDGTNGIAGKDGVGISKTTITYAKSTNGTTAPTTGYTTTVPSANPGEFVWTKTVWTYTDNTTETGYSVGKIGNTGATGANGKDGVAGKDGVGIQKTEIHYASSTSGTTKPSTGWSLTVPTTSPGNYLWTRTTWTYTDGSKEEGYSVSRIGKDGNTGKDGIAGKDGVGIKSTVINYATSSSGTTKPTSGWTSTVPSVTPGNYLWTRTVWTYTDNDVETGYSVSRVGKDGAKGDKGDKGATGTGIKSAEISYVIHTNGTTAPTLGWTSTVPTPKQGRYLWTRTITTYTDNTTSTTYSVAYQATNGQQGAAGNGVSSTTVTYAQTTSGTTTPTSWSSTRPAPIKGQYLWSRTIITYTNGSSSTAYNTSYSATDGQKGDKGDKGDTGPRGPQGIQGPSGSNGQSQWVHIRYSPNPTGSGMTTSPSSTTKYVGIAVTNSATPPGYTGFTWSKYVGEDGSRGPQGLPGDKGTDGKTTYTWIRYADTPTSGMSQYPDGKKYIGMAFNKTTQTESNNYSDYQWSLMPQNIEIGGRNLYPGTTNEWNEGTFAGWQLYLHDIPIGEDENLKAGDKITWSGILNPAKEPAGIMAHFTTNTGGYAQYQSNFISGGDVGKIVGHTVVPSNVVSLKLALRHEAGSVPSDTVKYKELKIEKGNTATDWTPAPEDIQSQIDGVGLTDKTELLSGTEIYTDKADDSVVHVEIDGNSYQHAGSGKNLAGNPKYWEYSGGSFYKDGEIHLPAKDGARIAFWIPWAGNPRWMLSADVMKGTGMFWNTAYYGADRRTSVYDANNQWTANGHASDALVSGKRFNRNGSYLDSKTKWIKFSISYSSNYQPEDVVLKNFMIADNSNVNYEPPIPNPDYPIEIHSLNDFDVVSSIGKRNIIKNSTKYDYSTTATIVHTNIMPDLKEELVVGQEYTFSFEVKADTSTSSSRVFINSTTTITKNIAFNTNWTRQYVNFTYDGGYYASIDIQIHPHIYPSGSGMKYIRNIKLEKGSTDTGWIPAPEDLLETDNHPLIDKINLLLDEPLRSVGDVKDRLFRDNDGIWKVERNVREYSFNGTESFSASNVNDNKLIRMTYFATPPVRKGHKNVTSNRFKQNNTESFALVSEESVDVHPTSENRVEFFINRDRLSTESSTGFSLWAKNNNLKIEYILKEPTIETLDQGLQDKLNNLRSFQDSNYVYTIINDKSDIISEKLKPTLHATFKGGGWYSRWKTEDDLRKHQAEINDKASAEDLTDVSNDLNTTIGDLSNTVDGKVDKSMYEEFLEHNANIQEQLSISTANAQEDITKALARTATVEQKLGEGAADWIFTHTKIRMSDEGITLGEEGSGSYLQISNEQISFFNGSKEPVAFINGGMLHINHAIFVESIQISQFMFSSEISGHLTLRYVGN